jgi:hypothetical protein
MRLLSTDSLDICHYFPPKLGTQGTAHFDCRLMHGNRDNENGDSGGTRTRLTFFNHVYRILIVAESHEFGMTKASSLYFKPKAFSPLVQVDGLICLGV